MYRRLIRLFAAPVVGAAALTLLSSALEAQRQGKEGEWRDYAGDVSGLKYSPLSQIRKQNVKDLRLAWRWKTADKAVQESSPLLRGARYEDTPLMVNGTVYTVTPLGMVAALDAATGSQRWLYDPESYKGGLKAHSVGWVVRGLSYWSDGANERILHSTTDAYLISIDARTGTPDPAFGNGGKVDLTGGIPNAVRTMNISGRRALVAGNVLVVGSAIQDPGAGREETAPPGFVKAFDARTGALLWTFHTIPRKGETGYETWLEGSAERTGNANAWGGMVWDPEFDYVYIATSSAGNDYYGALRPGDNLFADSIICVEARTGKRVWHFQGIHHDLWDWDFVSNPALIDITVDGRRIKALAAVNKAAFLYVLDRQTGKPVWPIPETPVPQSTAPNRERTSKTQPIPSRPAPLDAQGSTPDMVIDFTPDLKKRALEQLSHFETGPVFTPPSVKGTLVVPGPLGGANWGGMAFDPETGVLYVPTRQTMIVSRARLDVGARPAAPNPNARDAAPAGPPAAPPGPTLDSLMYVDGLPLFKPPYARVTALDMSRGERLWMTALGNGPRNHPLLKDLNLPPLGDGVLGGAPLVTKTLLFVGVTYIAARGRPQPTPWDQWNDPGFLNKVLYVFDKQTGEILHVLETDNMSASAPMTYMANGKQYLVVATGDGPASELMAYSLP